MAERQYRNWTEELHRGTTDGLYKQLNPDWSNVSDAAKAHVAGELGDKYDLRARYDTMPFGPGIPKGTA